MPELVDWIFVMQIAKEQLSSCNIESVSKGLQKEELFIPPDKTAQTILNSKFGKIRIEQFHARYDNNTPLLV